MRRGWHRTYMVEKERLDKPLIDQLSALLEGGQAYAGLAKIVQGVPFEVQGKLVDGMPHSLWQLLEHLRIAQRDILDFCAPPTGGYQPMEWPRGYWPEVTAPRSPEAWDRTVVAIVQDRTSFVALLTRPGADLYKPFLWGNGQNLLREALLIADHAAYHLGEIVVICDDYL